MNKYILLSAILVIALGVYWASPPQRDAIFCDAFAFEVTSPVVMYSAEWCVYCKHARAYLQDNNIQHCERDVEASAENYQQFTELGGSGVPLIVVGETVLTGFDEDELERALRANGIVF